MACAIWLALAWRAIVCEKTVNTHSGALQPRQCVRKNMCHMKSQAWCRLGPRNGLCLLRLRRRLNLHCALAADIRPNPSRTFSLFHPDNRSAVTSAAEMQNHILARLLRVSEVIEIYNAAIGQAHQIHGQH